MERIDLYDRYRQRTGFVTTRGQKLPAGLYRLVVHVCMFNSRGEMLIQQRQTTKTVFPGLWDISAGGQVAAGETSEQAAQREIAEELGLHLDLSNLLPHASMSFDEGFDDVYVLRSDAELSSLMLQQEEVQGVDWASREQIHSMIQNGTFIPYYPAYIDFLFSLPGTDGTFQKDETWNEA